MRRAAVEQLPFFDDAARLRSLIDVSTTRRAAVRAAAAAGARRASSIRCASTPLLRALDDADSWVRYVALRSLAAIGATRHPSRRRRPPAKTTRLRTFASRRSRSLGGSRRREALEILEPLTASGNDDIARAAIHALGHVDRSGGARRARAQIRAPASWHRLAAIEALTRRQRIAVPRLLQWAAAADSDAVVMSAAIDGAGQSRGRERMDTGSDATVRSSRSRQNRHGARRRSRR